MGPKTTLFPPTVGILSVTLASTHYENMAWALAPTISHPALQPLKYPHPLGHAPHFSMPVPWEVPDPTTLRPPVIPGRGCSHVQSLAVCRNRFHYWGHRGYAQALCPLDHIGTLQVRRPISTLGSCAKAHVSVGLRMRGQGLRSAHN